MGLKAARLVGGVVESPLVSRRWRRGWHPGMAPWDLRSEELFAPGLESCQQSSSSLPQIEVIMDWQTHAGQLFTVPLLRLRFQRLAVHTIYYCSSCFLPTRGRNSHVREGCKLDKRSHRKHIYTCLHVVMFEIIVLRLFAIPVHGQVDHSKSTNDVLAVRRLQHTDSLPVTVTRFDFARCIHVHGRALDASKCSSLNSFAATINTKTALNNCWN